MIKTYYKIGDGRWTTISQTKFSSAMNYVNKRNCRIWASENYIQKKSLFGALFDPKV